MTQWQQCFLIIKQAITLAMWHDAQYFLTISSQKNLFEKHKFNKVESLNILIKIGLTFDLKKYSFNNTVLVIGVKVRPVVLFKLCTKFWRRCSSPASCNQLKCNICFCYWPRKVSHKYVWYLKFSGTKCPIHSVWKILKVLFTQFDVF